MDASQYPGFPSNYWYPQSQSTPHYANAYPSGTEMQPAYNPQAVPPGAYPNGHGVYNPAQGHYSASNFHPSNPFYCADQMPQRAAPGPYPSQGCPPEQSGAAGSGQPRPVQHHHYTGPHCQAVPGYPPGSYSHYSDGGHAMPPNPPYPTGQALHPRPQAEGWGHSGGYGPSPQQWQAPQQQQPGQQQQQPGLQQQHPQNHYGNPVRPQHPPAWPGTGTGAPPPYQPKDQQHQNPPPPVGPKPQPTPSGQPPLNPAVGKPTDFSSPPQLYNRTGRGGGGGGAGPMEPNSSQGQPPASAPSPATPAPPAVPPQQQQQQQPSSTGPQTHGPIGPQLPGDSPGLARVHQIMVRVLLLQEDVDEFVGKKTDKTYRYLEELLTKELLVLDSVETRGQEAVRQARKEAVQRIQVILDRLEKKAF